MIRALVLFALCSCGATLKYQTAQTSSWTNSVDESTEADWSNTSCGVVLGAFGSGKYVDIGRKVAEHIRSLEIKTGWCPGQMSLDKVPVALFSDANDGVCPEGVKCLSEKDMDPWDQKEEKFGGGKAHLGSWKYRFYHAQMLVHSPFTHTLYLDVDALPCNGHGVELFFSLFRRNVQLGSVVHILQPENVKKTLHSGAPEGLSLEERKNWTHWEERNAGVILADLRTTKPMFEEWSERIKKTAGHADGDQFAYRQATFNHRNQYKEFRFGDNQVCRNGATTRWNCGTGCWVMHKPNMESLAKAKIIKEPTK